MVPIFNIGTLSISDMDMAEKGVLTATEYIVNNKYHDYIGWFKQMDEHAIDFLVTEGDIRQSGCCLSMDDFLAAGSRLTDYKLDCFNRPQIPLIEVIEKVASGKGIRMKFSWEAMNCLYKD